MSRFLVAVTLGTTLLFQACGHLIYDEDDGTGASGENSFSMVDASKYTTWAYINLSTKTASIVDEYSQGSSETAPDEWHFAMHRFDVKTCGAEVMETSFSTIDDLIASGSVPVGEFVADVWTDDTIAYDMSQMMAGIIQYAESDYNPEMSKWMEVDLSNMPPNYTPSNRVYVLKFPDGVMAAVRFTDFVGPMEVKGYNSFDYVYPLSF